MAIYNEFMNCYMPSPHDNTTADGDILFDVQNCALFTSDGDFLGVFGYYRYDDERETMVSPEGDDFREYPGQTFQLMTEKGETTSYWLYHGQDAEGYDIFECVKALG